MGGAVPAPPRPKTVLAAVPISRMDLRWWRERHQQKLAELRRGRVDLVFLGDSITQDWELTGPAEWQNFRPAWDRFYGDRNAVNLGFKGDATSHLLWRIYNGELDGIAPKAAVILIGANNLGRVHWPAEDNAEGINTVVAEVRRRLPRTKILLLGILPSERSAWATQTTLDVNHALAAQYGNGAVPGVTFMDVGGVFMRAGALDRSLFLDPLLKPPEPPLHPTAQGQERMAAAIEPTLAMLMGDRNHLKPR
nr:GDSL-type esterase/lipase family protein [Limobrevibacterium gyesilva]